MNILIWYAGLYSASAILLKLAGFALFLWLARTLSVDDYANWGLLYALQTGLTTLALAGIVEVVVGLLKEHRSLDQQRKLFAAANMAFLLIALPAIALSVLVFVTFVRLSNTVYLGVTYALASGALLAFSSLQAQVVRLEEKHSWSLCFNFFASLAGLAGGFAVFFLKEPCSPFSWGAPSVCQSHCWACGLTESVSMG